ncbi:hypothetical protein PCASD_24879 [Puccinia coronata f. sp. avenae]|uniref:Uncharacterized protein n=1 Tax=Puccinia coronata f. sp. avenae TaxID=200324 RepID=A0A2N5TWG2_9BASI|nr:hypothetical protein PCASD_24879 [Puccinia coronata f. sp. avenae]
MWEKLVAGGTIVMELGDQEDSKKELILDQEEVDGTKSTPRSFFAIRIYQSRAKGIIQKSPPEI